MGDDEPRYKMSALGATVVLWVWTAFVVLVTVALMTWCGCAHEPVVLHESSTSTTRVEREKVRVPCFAAKGAPAEPCDDSAEWPCDEKPGGVKKYHVQCGNLSWSDCQDIVKAAWSDYGKLAAPFVNASLAECSRP